MGGARTIGKQLLVGLDVLRTYVSSKTKSVLCQLGDVVGEGVDVDDVEWWQHVCFVSRPPEATAGKKACQAVVFRTGGVDVVLATKDERGQDLAGKLEPGEFCVYAPGKDGKGQARILGKADGSLHLYSRKGNTESGAGMTVQLDAQGGAIRIINDKGFGIIIDADGVKITSGNAGLTLDASGDVTLVGTGQTQVDGAGILLGAVGVPGVDNAITGPAGIAGKPSPKVLIGSQ